jgi:thioredoxin 1
MSVIEIETTNQFNDEILNTVIVDYYTHWCSPCSRISPVMKKFAMKYNIDVLKVDVDKHAKLCSKIKSLPTISLYHNSLELIDYRVVGADINQIEQLFIKAYKIKNDK